MTDAELNITTLKFLKAQALIAKMNSINASVEGMKAFNCGRTMNGESPGFNEVNFEHEADKLNAIAEDFEKLSRS